MTASELKNLLWSKGWSKTSYYDGTGRSSFDNKYSGKDFIWKIWFKKGLHTVTIHKRNNIARDDGEKRVPLRLIELDSNGTTLLAGGWEIKL